MDSKMESNLTNLWVNFFTSAGIPPNVAATYALTFAENRIQKDMLLDLNKEYLKDMSITRMGDVIAILRHARQVHESMARDKVLSGTGNSTPVAAKVPVAAITGRATVASGKPSSPAGRMLEHYTRNPSPAETSPEMTSPTKRKLCTNSASVSDEVKKARLIRFSGAQQNRSDEGVTRQQTVFARVGSLETQPTKTVKPIYARLGGKLESTQEKIPLQKGALEYEGVLKGQQTKGMRITTSKDNVRRITAECSMRADEVRVSAKEKLALPKQKSVKFSNFVEYKEIESDYKKRQTVGIFNKPERRLCMPEPAGVKARLGIKNGGLNGGSNIHKRLGIK